MVVLALLVTAFALGVYVGRLVDRRLADAISAADRDDPFWRFDDLMAHRDPVPDAENSALVVAEAVSRLPENWPSDPAADHEERKPPVSEVAKAYERLSKTADNMQLDDEATKTLRNELEKYDEAVQVARTVADYERGRHELEFGPTLIFTRLPETQAARTPARLLAADAAMRAHDGDPDGALDSCRAIIGVGRSIGDEPFEISQLVRIAIGSVAMQSTRRVIGQGQPSNEALARLQALILDELAQPVMLPGLRGERATMTEVIRRLGTGELPIDALSGDVPKLNLGGSRGVIAPWGKLMFDNHRAVELEWMNEAVAIERKPVSTRPPLWRALQAEIDRVHRSRYGFITATLPLLLSSGVSAWIEAQNRYECELGTTAILLAAERHRRRSGKWPGSIAAIDSSILPNPPLDPFSGREFRMEHRDGRLLVFSIGQNLVDEHGAYEPKQTLTGRFDDVGGSAWDLPLRRQQQPPRDDQQSRSESPP